MNNNCRGAVPLIVLAALAMCAAGCAKPVIRTCYTPGGKCMDAVVAEIGKARTEVLVQSHALTAKPVADALAAARDSGASVSVILDRSYPFVQNSATYLAAIKGVPTFLDARHDVAGSNVVVVDKSVVITGTMLFTPDAEEKSADNLLIIESDSVAGSYVSTWYDHKAHADEFVPGSEPLKQEPVSQPKSEKKKTGKKKGTVTKKKIP
jgi:phosphatidylserine/phosphatidylglycerophosphate/cardiolipin synthase-like enzyme